MYRDTLNIQYKKHNFIMCSLVIKIKRIVFQTSVKTIMSGGMRSNANRV